MSGGERFAELWTDYLEGELDESGSAELLVLLTADESLVGLAADMYQMHRLLGVVTRTTTRRDEFVRDTLASLPTGGDGVVHAVMRCLGDRQLSVYHRSKNGPCTVWRWLGYATVVSLAVAMTLVVQRYLETPDASVVAAAPMLMEFVATLVEGENCVWADSTQHKVGQRLAIGPLRLEQGQAVVHFDSGAKMVMMGPVELVLESPGAVLLKSGKVAVRATQEAVGFRMNTAEGVVVDLGTEFVVSMDERGVVECQVLDGEVEWYSAGPAQKPVLLTKGEARRFSGGRVDTIAPNATSYSDFLPDPMHHNAQDELLAYEPFDYAATDAPVEQLNCGFGWRSAWRGRFVATDQMDVNPRMRIQADRSLDVPAGMIPAAGGHFVFHKKRQWRLRALPEPLDFRKDGVRYLSFFCRLSDSLPPDSEKWSELSVAFRSAANYWKHVIKFTIGAKNHPGVAADGNNSWSPVSLPTGKTLFVVCKVATSDRGPDQLFMKVYTPEEKVDEVDPIQWTVISRELHLNANMDYIIPGAIRRSGSELDELRYGTTWRSVVPFMLQKEAN